MITFCKCMQPGFGSPRLPIVNGDVASAPRSDASAVHISITGIQCMVRHAEPGSPRLLRAGSERRARFVSGGDDVG
jgi:hypothetical protein